jgi:nucleoid-associated protein YgaU
MGLLDRLFGGGKKSEADAGGAPISYTSGPGDTCRSLAKRFYGDENRWEDIYKPNAHLLKDEVQSGSDSLLVGTTLTIKSPKFDASGQPVAAG